MILSVLRMARGRNRESARELAKDRTLVLDDGVARNEGSVSRVALRLLDEAGLILELGV